MQIGNSESCFAVWPFFGVLRNAVEQLGEHRSKAPRCSVPMRRNTLNVRDFLSVWLQEQTSTFKPSVSDQFHAGADTQYAGLGT